MPAAAQPSTEQVQGSASSAGYGSGWKDREPPPGFDGRNPDKVFPRWVKELELWKFETEIPKEKWGVKVFRQLQGSAKSVADGLSFEELACEKGLDNLMKVLKDHYQPHLQVSLPKSLGTCARLRSRSVTTSSGASTTSRSFRGRALSCTIWWLDTCCFGTLTSQMYKKLRC